MEIGSLEAEVLSAIKKLKRVSARDVMMHLNVDGKELAYTTIATTLNRLFEKKMLYREHRRYKGGKQYIYYAADDDQKRRKIVGTAITRLVDSFGPSAVSAIMEKLEEISPEKLEELKMRVAKKRGKDADN